MPFVSRPNPSFLYDPTRIIWLDASQSNTLINSGGGILSQWEDSGNLGNNVVANGTVTDTPIVSLSNYSYLYNGDLVFRSAITSITGFLVFQPGYSYTGTTLLSVFGSFFLNMSQSNSITATNGSGVGVSVFQPYNSNSPNIITFILDGTNVQLSINGSTFTSNPCPISLPSGIGQYPLQWGSPSDNLFEIDTRNPPAFSLNSISELLLYNRSFSLSNIRQTESNLGAKWSVSYPRTSNSTPVLNIPDIINWINPTNASNIHTYNIALNIDKVYSSELLSNTLIGDPGLLASAPPIYNSNTHVMDYTAPNTAFLSNSYIYGQGLVNGLTVSMVLVNNPFPGGTYSNGLIGSFFRVDGSLTNTEIQPCIVNNATGFILCADDIPLDPGANFGNPVYVGTSGTEFYTLTAMFDSNFNTQLYVNGYPMPQQQLPNGFNWVANILNNLYSTSPNPPNNFTIGSIYNPNNLNYESSGIQIGEILMYKRLLNSGELNTVHAKLFTDYAIHNNISTDGLVGWWDASTCGVTNGNPITEWYPLYGGINLINDANNNSVPFLRSWYDSNSGNTISFVDLNNGTPSVMYNNLLSVDLSNISLFIVGTNLLSPNGGYPISFTKSNGTSYDISYNNYTFNYEVFATTSTVPNTLSILNLNASNTTLNNFFVLPASNGGGPPVGVSDISDISNITIGGLYSDIIGATNFYTNSIAEIIMYNRPLYPGEYTNIYGYLQSKYGFQMRYYSTPDTVNDLAYWYDPNDLNVVPQSSWSNHAAYYPGSYTNTYGPDLSNNTIQITNLSNINSNYFVTIGRPENVFTGNPSELGNISNSFTFFVVTNNVSAPGNIFSMIPFNSDSNVYDSDCQPGGHLYPGYAYFTNLSGSNTFNITNYTYKISNSSFLIGDITESTISPTVNPPIYHVDLTSNTNVTCVSYNNSTSNFNIRTKGSLGETNTNVQYAYTASNAPHLITLGALYVDSLGNVYNQMSGNIGEVMFYNRCLDDIEKLCMFNYLEQKWINGMGPTVPPLLRP